MKLSGPFLVGLVVLAAVASMFYFWTQLMRPSQQLDEDSAQKVVAYFDDASGLKEKSRVTVAGIDVGRIDKIELDPATSRAKLTMLLDPTLPMKRDARIAKNAEGLLGDKKLEIAPGKALEPLPLNASGELQFLPENTEGMADFDRITHELALVAPTIRAVADDIKQVTGSMAAVFGSEKAEGQLQEILNNLQTTASSIDQAARIVNSALLSNENKVGRIFDNFEDLSADLKRLSGSVVGSDQEITDIIHNTRTLSEKLNNIADSIEETLGQATGAPEGGGSVSQTLGNINETAENLASITEAIDKGPGDIYNLVHETKLTDTATEILEDAGDIVKTITGIRTDVDLRTEYVVPLESEAVGTANLIQPGFKNYLRLKLWTKEDKHYLIELITDPRGKFERFLETTRCTENASGDPQCRFNDELENDTVEYERSLISFGSLKFSLQFAKVFYNLTLRFGIIEDTGGIGINLSFLEDALDFQLDIFQFGFVDRFGNELEPRVKMLASYQFFEHVYAHAGIDDPLNGDIGDFLFPLPAKYARFQEGGRTGVRREHPDHARLFSWFLGLGIRFTDDDLKALLTITPIRN